MSKRQEMQRLIRHYRDQTGKASVDMHEVAQFAVESGWPLPKPKSAIDMLAEKFSDAARDETRIDKKTGQPYRANLAVTTWLSGTQITLWTDIEEAPRKIAHQSFFQRREQMVGDAVQLTFDVMHWNRINSDEAPIAMPMDFTDDVAWRISAADGEDKAA